METPSALDGSGLSWQPVDRISGASPSRLAEPGQAYGPAGSAAPFCISGVLVRRFCAGPVTKRGAKGASPPSHQPMLLRQQADQVRGLARSACRQTNPNASRPVEADFSFRVH